MTPLETYLRQRLQRKKLLLMTHVVVGYPSLDANMVMLEAMQRAEVDVVECQLPFSEPIADGPVFVRANQHALEAGMHWAQYFKFMQRATAAFDFKILMMGYYNSVLQMGHATFCGCLAEHGGSGFIVADLPPEEASDLLQHADTHHLSPIVLMTPTNTLARLHEVVDGRRHAEPVGRGGPRRGLAGEHPDALVGHPQARQQPADVAGRVGHRRVDQPVLVDERARGQARRPRDAWSPGGARARRRAPAGSAAAARCRARSSLGPRATSASRSWRRAGISSAVPRPTLASTGPTRGGERRDERRGHELGDRAGGDHPEQLGCALGVADGGLGLGAEVHHLRGDADEPLTAGRELHAVGRRGDQRIAEVLAQRRQRAGHRRLAHAQHPRRGLHRAEPGDQHEDLELRERHGLTRVWFWAAIVSSAAIWALSGNIASEILPRRTGFDRAA